MADSLRQIAANKCPACELYICDRKPDKSSNACWSGSILATDRELASGPGTLGTPTHRRRCRDSATTTGSSNMPQLKPVPPDGAAVALTGTPAGRLRTNPATDPAFAERIPARPPSPMPVQRRRTHDQADQSRRCPATAPRRTDKSATAPGKVNPWSAWWFSPRTAARWARCRASAPPRTARSRPSTSRPADFSASAPAGRHSRRPVHQDR